MTSDVLRLNPPLESLTITECSLSTHSLELLLSLTPELVDLKLISNNSAKLDSALNSLLSEEFI
ncbi:unnamed protein product, partial [Rotaria sp. Silwood2]